MKIEEISQYAAHEEMPPEANARERLLWYTLRDVYRDFRTGMSTKEQGELRKKQAIKEFEEETAYLERARKYMMANANLWIRIESAARAYRENKTIENADAFLEAVYGVTFHEVCNDSTGDQK
ncbi:MAG: hypothetical protein IKV50_09140 [Clostridia bacterium]|nr:hypothetical protein [Clostridia bacterium]MBR5264841.1 hypothetical protein [Clostridia bacterium]